MVLLLVLPVMMWKKKRKMTTGFVLKVNNQDVEAGKEVARRGEEAGKKAGEWRSS